MQFKMAAPMSSKFTMLTTPRYHCLQHILALKERRMALKRVLSTFHEEKHESKESRTNWSLDTKATSHRRHAGVRQMKTIKLPDVLTDNIASVLDGLTIRNLIPEATRLSNYLSSRKRPVEESELRAAARHFSEEIGLEDVDAGDVNSQLFPQEGKRKIQHVMKNLRRNLYKWQSIEYDDVKSLAYMLARMPPNYAVLSRVLNEIKRGDPGYVPSSILDFGSGLGTTIWAAHNTWGESVKEYYLVEVSKAMHQLSERLLQVSAGKEELLISNVYFRYFMPVSLRARYSMTVSAYSLLELPSFQDRVNTVRSLWKLTDDYLVLIENGSYESYLALMEARDAILMMKDQDQTEEDSNTEEPENQFHDRLKPQIDQRGGYVFAPCSHDDPCPRLQESNGIPCNFEQTYQPLTQFSGKRSTAADIERFTYLILKKGPRIDTHDWPRVVKPVLKKSRHVICRLCCNDGSLGEAVFTKSKHSKDMYLCARYTNWGDLLPAAQSEITDTDTDS
ncbi:methyltransferase-like protein 17, mitochondrial isoform X1 [Lytechinus pictus]|uniref:methyltransferase-like protein 17, mitochondrial isoform X1 n=1 Tax=Lytechinus pictus TaxID=7653 RepID=UPI0030BA12D4